MKSLILSLALIGQEPDLYDVANEAILKAEIYKLYYETCTKENSLVLIENQKLRETIKIEDNSVPLYIIIPVSILIGGLVGAGAIAVIK